MGVTVWLETNGKRCQSEITMPYGCGRHYIAMRYNSTELCPCLPRQPRPPLRRPLPGSIRIIALSPRSEEHTSKLQSLMRNSYAVFCLKKTQINRYTIRVYITFQQKN